MISTFTAFFDANVFYGARLRSLVLYVALTKIYRARWSNLVHDEWIRNLLADRTDLSEEDLQSTRDAMDAAIPDCLVEGFESLIECIELPDPDDRHVVAAAIMTRANVIVSFNLKDFPEEALAPYRLHARHPDEFLIEAYDIAPAIFVEAAREDFLHYGNPPLEFDEYLDSLKRGGVPMIAEKLRPLQVLIVDQ
ncbi:MAG: PIN domain-containing protein [Rhodobiaceae bacterium]|nr:PIN domain-containing protein [Rhodobiaceae bacterium]